jgi:hypothetical protein
MNKDYGIGEALKQIGIEGVNKGLCTGTIWQETKGELMTSYSPADGKKLPTSNWQPWKSTMQQ